MFQISESQRSCSINWIHELGRRANSFLDSSMDTSSSPQQRKIVVLPLLMQRIIRALMSKLMDPDHVKLNCYVMRLFAAPYLGSDTPSIEQKRSSYIVPIINLCLNQI